VLGLSIGSSGQEMGRDVLSLDPLLAVLLLDSEADAALLHEAQKQLLLRHPVLLPNPLRKLRASEAATVALDLPEALRVAVEHRVDGFERPRLVERSSPIWAGHQYVRV